MADVSKAQKLASARKKFKELKKEKKKNSAHKTDDNNESTPTTREQTPVELIPPENIQEPTQLPNYFIENTNYNGHSQPAAFFDSYSQKFQPNFYQPSSSYFDNGFVAENVNHQNGEFKDIKPYIAEAVSNSAEENRHEETAVSQIFGTIKSEPQHRTHEEITNSSVFSSIKTEATNDEEVDNSQIFNIVIKTEGSPEIKTEISNFQTYDAVTYEPSPPPPQLSSVESLRQITNQMAELMNPDSAFLPSTIESELEVRNQELAALLDQGKIKTEHLSATLMEYQAKLAQAEAEIRDKDLNSDNKIDQEISTLKEELQCHVQTVGILVAEKAELVANLSQFQMVAKQKTADCEELQGRLKTSRSRVADVERELALLKSEKLQNDNLGREQNADFDKLRKDYQNIKDEKDELLQDLLEVREKLKNSSENNLVFQQQIAELSNQLSMANIKIQQLTIGGSEQVSGQVEELTKERFALEKQITDLNHTIKTITKERDESSLQYQQYAQQLNAQLSNLATRLEQLQKENESLNMQEQNRIKHIGELEKQLQNIQNDQINFAVQRSSGETKVELDEALDLIERLKTENTELQEDNVKVLNEKELIVKELEAKEESVAEYERLVEELRGNQPDNAKLLAIMESDKVAAARAVSQNTEMKKQMESMEEVFEKLNNDKIELTEKLSTEQRSAKDLFEKLQKTELHLQTLADAIEIKDKELIHLRENSMTLNKQVLQSEQLTDRLRHYEAKDHSSHSLQSELQEAKQTISRLTDEIHRLNEEKKNEAQIVDTVDSSDQTKESVATDTNHNDEWSTLDKESAMKHLEEKFLKTMQDIANLTEEKQRLEHLVLQLQGETETIGEYVALYQHQRSILKQKAVEKDQQLTQLANDREQMKNKLEKLNDLVRRLVVEKGSVPSELLHHNHESENLCAEHAQISSEINKIAQSNVNLDVTNEDDRHGSETAEQIIALLSEIKSSNLVQPHENFHHCPWCSGQLITV